MEVLHINCNYAGTVLHRHMITHLNEYDIKSCVYCPIYQKEDIDVSTPGAEVILSRCFSKWHRFVFDYKQSRILKDLQKKCDVSAYRCIHAYTLFTDGNAARKLGKKYNLPYVVAVRATDVQVFFKRLFYLRKRGVNILKDAAAVFFLSESYRTLVLDTYVPANLRQEILDKSYIMPNGIDDFWLENRFTDKKAMLEETAARIAQKQLKVVYAGVISNRKNPIATQEALQLLRKRGWNVKYTAVGRVADKDLHEKMCAYPDTAYVEQQPKKALLKFYRENDIFVMPSHSETFGLVYSEAMSQGLPVLYTGGQGFDGQFPEGTVGYSVMDNSPEDIADKIEAVASDYVKLTENALNLAEKFRWADICGKYKEIYDEIVKTK